MVEWEWLWTLLSYVWGFSFSVGVRVYDGLVGFVRSCTGNSVLREDERLGVEAGHIVIPAALFPPSMIIVQRVFRYPCVDRRAPA